MDKEFEEVCRAYFSRIYNYIYARVLKREAAQDITQDVFVCALAHWADYDSSRGSHQAWLCRIAASRLADYFRKAHLRREVLTGAVPEDLAASEGSLVDEKDATLIEPNSQRTHDILRRLSVGEREFLSLRYALDMSNGEIAALLGISDKAVCERYRRLLAKCRKIDAEKQPGAGEA